jgi:cell division protein FtsL
MSVATRPPVRSTRSRALALFAVTVFFTSAALAHVWVRLQVVRIGYQISHETEREKRLLQTHRKLQVERALLRSPERLERLARERLNLTMPDPGTIGRLKSRRMVKRSRGMTPVAVGGDGP